MKREFPEIPLVGVGAVIIDFAGEAARVVLVKRAHPPLQAQWSIPGGVLEVGELVREAAVREVREETGLGVEPGELLGVYDRVLRDAEQRVQYHYVLIDFLCRPRGISLRAFWFKVLISANCDQQVLPQSPQRKFAKNAKGVSKF